MPASTDMTSPFQHYPEIDPPRRRRFRSVPFRVVLPNLVTLLSLVAGLTAIRMAIEGRMELAVYAVVAAAALDGVDGRLARMLKGTSKFGAELDSLADFVNFGVAPAMVLYIWTLHDLSSVGWAGSLILAMCMALRLARFNVAIDTPKPAYAANFFTGVPAPAGAILALLPVTLGHLAQAGLPIISATVTLVYTLVVAALLVSRLPTFSFKKVGMRIPREWVIPIFVVLVGLVVLVVSYPFPMLALSSAVYLALLPVAYIQYRRYARQHGETVDDPEAPATAPIDPALDGGSETPAEPSADRPRLH